MILIYPVEVLVNLSSSTRKADWEIITMVSINNIPYCFCNLCISAILSFLCFIKYIFTLISCKEL